MPNCRQLQRVATHKPDVLFSILKQIQTDANVSLIEVSADDGGDDDIIAGSDDIIISEEESEPAGLVGPTAAELESCKELIQFDHIYHKPTSTSPQQGQMSEVVEVKIDPESESEAVAQNEVICSSQDISTPVTDNSYTDNALIDIDELLDLSSFNWDSMNNLDLEALTASSDTDNITPSNIAPCTKSNTSVSILPKTNTVNVNITSSAPAPPQIDLSTDSYSLITSPLNDSVYGSDMGSPLSDDTSSFDHLFEDSFTELFPSLA